MTVPISGTAGTGVHAIVSVQTLDAVNEMWSYISGSVTVTGLQLYVQKVLCSEGPMFGRCYVQKVLCLESPMFRRFYVQKVLCSEIFVQKVLCLESVGDYLNGSEVK